MLCQITNFFQTLTGSITSRKIYGQRLYLCFVRNRSESIITLSWARTSDYVLPHADCYLFIFHGNNFFKNKLYLEQPERSRDPYGILLPLCVNATGQF